MNTNTIEFRQLIVNHTAEHISPLDYDLPADAWHELIARKMNETRLDTPRDAGERDVYAGTFLFYFESIREFFINDLDFDPARVAKMSDERVWDLYRHFIGKAYRDLYDRRLTPQTTKGGN